jgi:hypothetical protein
MSDQIHALADLILCKENPVCSNADLKSSTKKILNCPNREQNPRLLRRPTRCLTTVPTELSMAYRSEPVKFNAYMFIQLFYYYIQLCRTTKSSKGNRKKGDYGNIRALCARSMGRRNGPCQQMRSFYWDLRNEEMAWLNCKLIMSGAVFLSRSFYPPF